MQRRGNPRTFQGTHGDHRRHPQGNRPGIYGSSSSLEENFRNTGLSASGIQNQSSGPRVTQLQSGFRQNRSASSDQSSQRRNYSHQNQRGRNARPINPESGGQFRAGGRNSNEHPRGRRPMGFRALESLLEKDSEELILELSNSKRGILEFLQSNLTDDAIVLFVKILRKVSDSAFEPKYKVLQRYLDEIFVDRLAKYIVFLPMQGNSDQKRNQHFWRDPDDFWNNLNRISQEIYDSIPTFAIKILPDILKGLLMCFPNFEDQHGRHISDGIKDSIKTLQEAVQSKIKDLEEQSMSNLKKKVNNEDYEQDEEPPDDFRQISVYPLLFELLSGSRGFLRKNVVKGPYKDVNHYLDVQFRLLREDFVGPLREGIVSFRSESKKRIENVKIYRKVRFLNPETVNEQYCIRLLFDSSNKKKNFKYENSRRLMFGSLLCFTPDNFKSIIFGKVADRKLEDLQRGQLIVGFQQNTAVNYNIQYLMVECSVYFEPYFHVLNVLQNMSVEDFPMEQYIIQVDPNVQPPEYLRVPGCRYNIHGVAFSPLLNFPNLNFYNLNQSQLEAFKAALTQEFCIIQGPPGTGKTFLGLKIAKTLLENKDVWYKKTPMLVICYTNHALDQFLEGISEFTKLILRVGGQSKNEKLQQFNLRNKRTRTNPAIFQQRDEVQTVLGKIRSITENLKLIEFYHSVRAFEVFEDVVPNFKNSWFGNAKKHEILNWLLGGIENTRLPEYGTDLLLPQVAEFSNLKINDGSAEESDEDGDDVTTEMDDLEATLDDIFNEDSFMAVQCSIPLVTTASMMQQIAKLEGIISILVQNENPTVEDLLKEEQCKNELFDLKNRYVYLNRRLSEGKQRARTIKEQPRSVDLTNPHKMPPDDRWNLYFYWLNLYKQKLMEKLEFLNKQFREEFKTYEQMRDIENTNTMKNVLVVGMTTTGAARLRSSLQALKCPVVIVEEAAEVLEAHIITSLTKYCKHLILIGDHQQLKPSTANYVERFYNLGISLFERMVLNKIQLYTLGVQHRMRPEISSLITPTIYPSLEDHHSVNDRPAIAGIDNCLFFINHDHKEENCDGTSKKNFHEANFLIYLARHLILNGYKPENITILAAYLGQMFEMQKEKKKHKQILENIRIAVLDNYQGEECDIILLSLVRNNDENKIGFLSIENRVCVALSRARNGFYIMGNMNQLCAASELWRKIRITLVQQNSMGSELTLRCQVHPDQVTYVKTSTDFLDISEGGCNQKCGAPLICGHKCTSLCHVLNRDHNDYKCRERCGKQLCDDPRHICLKTCYQECGRCTYLVPRNLACDHTVDLECHLDPDAYSCDIPVTTTLPCGHIADKPCYRNAETYRCPHPCEVKVEPCGHACESTCHVRRDPDHLQYKCKKKCARYRKGCTVETENHLCLKFCYEECDPCAILVRKKRTICPHVFDVPCSSNVDEIICEKPCNKLLPCGHKCKSKCNEPCGKCEIKVDKVSTVCGHTIKVKCCEEPDRKLCNKKCPLTLRCGHLCTKKCNEPCTTDCKEKVNYNRKAPCGHAITEIRCSVATSDYARQDPEILLKYCNHPCRDQLKCDHKCSGTCGECHQGRIHKRCGQKCGFPLVCNHPCEFPCRQACRPCARPCPYKCKHSACSKKCGDICTPCKEKCSRSCRHQRCTKFCGDICNVPPCEERCESFLKCGHQCIGFCGDPCPGKCIICHKEELTVIFFGFEEDEDARFVRLQDCGHIFESVGLEHWLKRDDGEISFKLCPSCKTPIKTTQRYSDLIKQAMSDVAKVKMNMHGSSREIDLKRIGLQIKLKQLQEEYAIFFINYCPKIGQVLDAINKRMQVDRKGKRQSINKPELNALESKMQIIQHIADMYNDTRSINTPEIIQINFIMKTLIREEDFITDQEIGDIQNELNRLSRINELERIKQSVHFNAHYSSNKRIKPIMDQVNKYIFCVGKFYDEYEQNVMQLLKYLSKSVAAGVGISEQERREIVKAMGFRQGHWYKCPNGHPYAIGECGGAMQESKCPECGAKIGGTQHRLTAGNAVATEMDGAPHGAWSEAANMANYRLD